MLIEQRNKRKEQKRILNEKLIWQNGENLSKNKSLEDSKVYIGKKKSINYVLASMVILSDQQPVTILARGRSIARAVDVSEILINNFSKGSSYGKVKISTEELSNEDGTKSNVSSIEIEILPPKK